MEQREKTVNQEIKELIERECQEKGQPGIDGQKGEPGGKRPQGPEGDRGPKGDKGLHVFVEQG